MLLCVCACRYDEWVNKERIVDVVRKGDPKKQPALSQVKASAALLQKHKVNSTLRIGIMLYLHYLVS